MKLGSQNSKLDLPKTSQSAGSSSQDAEVVLSDGGVAVATKAAEKHLMGLAGESGVAGILGKSSKVRSNNPSHNNTTGYYSSDTALISGLYEYLRAGTKNGDSCIIIARPITIKRLLYEGILKNQTQTKSLGNSSYSLFSAQTILEGFMVDGIPDKKKFQSSIGKLIASATKSANSTRVFSEMATIIWEQGHQEVAIELEKTWKALAKSYPFSLYSSYPPALFQALDNQQ